jgi:molybdopterin-containing oxidoreductase family membrane subunit
MVEKALEGSRRYWLWIGVLLAFILAGFVAYLHEQEVGLAVTGLSRDVPWGLYIAQFVFCVGLGASALVVVLPYYLHNWKAFSRITVLGEILGMVSVFMAMVFIFVSMGRPMRLINVILYPHPRSLIFWDLLVLSTYVLINAVITITLVSAEHEQVSPPKWIRSLVLLSLPWAIGIHTVTAFLFSGLPGRSFWMTPVLAPRFLVSAFTSGPALLIFLLLVLRRLRLFDVGAEAFSKLTWFVTYCMLMNVFFVLMEVFTVFYSGIPEHKEHFQFLFAGLDGNYHMVPWMWLSALLALTSLVVLLVPKYRVQPALLLVACGSAFFSLWLDKGLGLTVGGFTPTPLGTLTHYTPTLPEWEVVLGIWALGALLITVLYKITLSVRENANG